MPISHQVLIKLKPQAEGQSSLADLVEQVDKVKLLRLIIQFR